MHKNFLISQIFGMIVIDEAKTFLRVEKFANTLPTSSKIELNITLIDWMGAGKTQEVRAVGGC